MFLGLGNGPRWDPDAFWTPKPCVLCQPPGDIFRPESVSFLGYIFFEVLGLFRGLLGALLGLLRLSWEASGPQKVLFYHGETTLLKNAAFWVFEVLDGPLGFVLPPSWADLVPKWSPKWAPKVVQDAPKSNPKNRFQCNPTF
jgi:hypothetical protein